MSHPLSKCKNVIDFEANKLDYWKNSFKIKKKKPNNLSLSHFNF